MFKILIKKFFGNVFKITRFLKTFYSFLLKQLIM